MLLKCCTYPLARLKDLSLFNLTTIDYDKLPLWKIYSRELEIVRAYEREKEQTNKESYFNTKLI